MTQSSPLREFQSNGDIVQRHFTTRPGDPTVSVKLPIVSARSVRRTVNTIAFPVTVPA